MVSTLIHTEIMRLFGRRVVKLWHGSEMHGELFFGFWSFMPGKVMMMLRLMLRIVFCEGIPLSMLLMCKSIEFKLSFFIDKLRRSRNFKGRMQIAVLLMLGVLTWVWLMILFWMLEPSSRIVYFSLSLLSDFESFEKVKLGLLM